MYFNSNILVHRMSRTCLAVVAVFDVIIEIFRYYVSIFFIDLCSDLTLSLIALL